MKSRLLLSLVFLLLFSTYKIQNNFNLSNYFSIDEILIENNKILNSTEIKNEFSFLYEKNIFFLKNKNIKKKLNKNFGDKVSFSIFYENLKKMNFPTNKIKSFYFFESNRWDLVTTKNQTVKLPSNNYLESLNNFLQLEIDQNFEKYKIFDYRINNQLILK